MKETQRVLDIVHHIISPKVHHMWSSPSLKGSIEGNLPYIIKDSKPPWSHSYFDITTGRKVQEPENRVRQHQELQEP